MNHSTFEDTFTSITKGITDLERVVALIHAKNCRIKDFVKVSGVSLCFIVYGYPADFELTGLQEAGNDKSESLKSKTVFGLLRGAQICSLM